MEELELVEMRNSLAALPELKKRLVKLNDRIEDAEQQVEALHKRLEAESYDVEKLEKESLSASLLRLIGKYEDKLDKETREMIAAKLNYDKAVSEVKELQSERDEVIRRISKLEKNKACYEEELRSREQKIQNSLTGEAVVKYRRLEGEREELSRQLFEIKEAQNAVYRVRATADIVMKHLEDAEGWATYDAWTRGGIFSHMAKYEHIDEAQAEFNTLQAQLKEMHRELLDVDILETVEITEIDGTTRTIDFWFDNIFTDLSVRDQISSNIEQLNSLYVKLDSITDNLQENMQETDRKLAENDNEKDELLIHMT